MEITALQNPLIKETAELKQKKYRLQRQKFLAEGLNTVEVAVSCGAAETLFYTHTEDMRILNLLKKAVSANVKSVCVSDRVMKKIADTETPPGLAAVCKMQHLKLEEMLADGKTLLVLDRVSDPGNVGTIIRTADAAGFGGVVLLRGSADIYAPKAVRASMGSLFNLNVLDGIEEKEFIVAAKEAGYTLLVTSLKGDDNFYGTDLSGQLAIVMGSEISGVSDTLIEASDKKVFIPMEGRAESLNVAVAAAIVMFEILRRRL
ncbi:MAG: RNA methyltransferase [Phascolarctobacterium sp.]|nr:RNA methyltransferase [Phascolarctobacterium sp.]